MMAGIRKARDEADQARNEAEEARAMASVSKAQAKKLEESEARLLQDNNRFSQKSSKYSERAKTLEQENAKLSAQVKSYQQQGLEDGSNCKYCHQHIVEVSSQQTRIEELEESLKNSALEESKRQCSFLSERLETSEVEGRRLNKSVSDLKAELTLRASEGECLKAQLEAATSSKVTLADDLASTRADLEELRGQLQREEAESRSLSERLAHSDERHEQLQQSLSLARGRAGRAMASIFGVRTNRMLVMAKIIDATASDTIASNRNEGYSLCVNSLNEIVAKTTNIVTPVIDTSQTFPFDYVFDRTSNAEVNSVVAHLVDRMVAENTSACIIADGYSGSGKSCTMFTQQDSVVIAAGHRLFAEHRVESVNVTCTEICITGSGKDLKEAAIKPPGDAYRERHNIGLEWSQGNKNAPYYTVRHVDALRKLFEHVGRCRLCEPTDNNLQSSRSHVKVELWSEDQPHAIRLDLIDLAGAEGMGSASSSPQTIGINHSRSSINNILRAYRTFNGRKEFYKVTAARDRVCACQIALGEIVANTL
jgi:hypothetical protein